LVAASQVAHHIAHADFVFRTTDMNLDALPDNIGFAISNIHIFESTNGANYRLRDTSLDRLELMNELCRYKHDDYCMVVAFTYRELGRFLFLRLSSYH